MKNAIIFFLSICIVILYVDRLQFKQKKNIQTSGSYYRSNLSREEMKEALNYAVNDSIILFVPGDTTVMPYLIKRIPIKVSGEIVIRDY